MNYKYISYAIAVLFLLSLVWLGYAVNDYINLDSKSAFYEEDKSKVIETIGLRVLLNVILAICWLFAYSASTEDLEKDKTYISDTNYDSSKHLYNYDKEQDKSHEIVFNL